MKVTKNEYKKSLKIVKKYEEEQKQQWSCDKCTKFFTNPFDQQFCKDDYKVDKGGNCRGKKFETIEKQKKVQSKIDEPLIGGDGGGVLDGYSGVSDWEKCHGRGFWGNASSGYHYDEDVSKW